MPHANRRAVAVTCVLLAWVGVLTGAAPAVGAPRPLAYVANAVDGTVSVISTTTDRVIATVPVGVQPSGVAVSHDGARVYVANRGSDSVSVIDAETSEVVGTIAVGDQPSDVAITPDDGFAYVTNFASSTVSVVDTTALAVVATIPVAVQSTSVAMSPGGGTAFVTSAVNDASSGTLSFINTGTRAVARALAVGARPTGAAVTPDGAYVFSVNQLGDSFVFVSTTDPDHDGGGQGAGAIPTDAAIAPSAPRMAWITNTAHRPFSPFNGFSVTVVNMTTLQMVGHVSLSAAVDVGTQGIAFTPNGAKAYVGVPGQGAAAVIATGSRAVTASVPVGLGPGAVAVGPPVTLELGQQDPMTATVDRFDGYQGQLAFTNADGALTVQVDAAGDAGAVNVDATGAISAAKTLAPGTYTVAGTAADEAGATGTWSFTLTVEPGTLVQGPPTSATVVEGTGFSTQLFTPDTIGAVTYTQIPSAGSAALTVTSAGLVHAEPTLAPGRYSTGGAVSDAAGDTGTWSFTLTVLRGCGRITQSVGRAPAVGTPVKFGDIIETGPDGAVGLTLPDRSVIAITEDTRFVCNDVFLNPPDSGSSLVTLLKGAIFGLFVKTSGWIGKHEFGVCPPEGCLVGSVGGIRGSAFTAAVLDDGRLLLHVIEGTGVIYAKGRKATTFPAGEGVLIDGRKVTRTLRLPPGTASLIPASVRPPVIGRLRANARAGRRAVVRFMLDRPARLTLRIRKGARTIASVSKNGKKGANVLALRRALPRGSYAAELTAARGGPTSTAAARLRIR